MDNKNVTLYGMENDMALLQFLRSKITERFTSSMPFCYLIGKMSGQGKAHKGDSSKDISTTLSWRIHRFNLGACQ
jgi:hypothetical protein